ncbi:MAG: hypothetical protein RLN60_01585 [Phycisphaerales bacterium]
MTTKTLIRRAIPVLCLAVLAVAAGEASAQQFTAPTPGQIEPSSPLPAYIVGILLMGGALALTVFPSKRSHED